MIWDLEGKWPMSNYVSMSILGRSREGRETGSVNDFISEISLIISETQVPEWSKWDFNDIFI